MKPTPIFAFFQLNSWQVFSGDLCSPQMDWMTPVQWNTCTAQAIQLESARWRWRDSSVLLPAEVDCTILEAWWRNSGYLHFLTSSVRPVRKQCSQQLVLHYCETGAKRTSLSPIPLVFKQSSRFVIKAGELQRQCQVAPQGIVAILFHCIFKKMLLHIFVFWCLVLFILRNFSMNVPGVFVVSSSRHLIWLNHRTNDVNQDVFKILSNYIL